MNNPSYIDRVTSRLNACSLEVLQTYQHQLPTNDTDNRSPDGTVDNDGGSPTKNSVSALVVGCYQLDETTMPTSATCDNDNDEDDGDEDGCSTDSKPIEAATRSGELQLYIIDSRESCADLRFGEPVHVFDSTSGVLDGKWYQRRPLPLVRARTVIATDDPVTAMTTSRDNQPGEGEGGRQKVGGNDDGGSDFVYATACASGHVELYALRRDGDEGRPGDEHRQVGEGEGGFRLKPVGRSPPPSADDGGADRGLCLSLAWDESTPCPAGSALSMNGDSETNAAWTRIVSSYSGGSLAVHAVSPSPADHSRVDLTPTHYIPSAHSLFGVPSEVWTVCFASNAHYSTHADTIISGGDDGKMKLWDLRLASTSAPGYAPARPTHVVGDKEFGAGVTTVSYHPLLEHVFAAGSYDAGLRIWDVRRMGGGPLAKVDDVGGGVWRIRWHPKDEGRLLVGAMHGGCRVVEVPGLGRDSSGGGGEDGGGGLEASVVKEFTEHESMAYGADWLLYGKSEAAASCSFYDRQAFIWESTYK